MTEQATTCVACGHEHKQADGACDCGCSAQNGATMGGKVCSMCGHEHKNAGGSCDCGCGSK